MIGAVVFVIAFVLFTLISLVIDLPPGIWVHDWFNIPASEYSSFVNGIVNGVMYGGITWLIFALARIGRKKKPVKPSILEKEIEELLEEVKEPKGNKLLKNIPPGEKPPQLLNAVVEVISGSRDKYEYNHEWEAFVLDRVIPSSVVFPVEYGFVPQTWFDDEDPLDIMVLSYEPLEVGCIVRVRVIGALIIEDEKGVDPKILSVLMDDARFEGYKDISDVHKHKLREIQEFFETYKRLEPHKWVRFKEWKNAEDAARIVDYAIKRFESFKFGIKG